MTRIDNIGARTTIPGWPENDTIAGLLDALARWKLDSRWDLSGQRGFEPHPDRKPFRGPALRNAGHEWRGGTRYYFDGPPIHPEAPSAVIYVGNFIAYSFAFNITTDDRELIARLDAAIAANLARAW